MIRLTVLEGENRIPKHTAFIFLSYFLAHLGAIPELPAGSCQEIKASEGRQAVSGKYWLNFIKPDTPVLAHCDMETEGRVRQLNTTDYC